MTRSLHGKESGTLVHTKNPRLAICEFSRGRIALHWQSTSEGLSGIVQQALAKLAKRYFAFGSQPLAQPAKI
jgi:hypothetical protein